MNSSSIFWALVRHEWKLKGSWRRQNRSPVTKWWWIIYLSLVIIAALSTATYYAIHETLHLQNLWYTTLGFPYMLFFVGFGILKREWENDTHGWWLTLPYPRHWLIGAKWVAAWLRMLLVVTGLYVLGALYATVIALCLSHYTFADVSSFLLSGLNWFLLIVGFSPFLLAIGLLTAESQFTALRPISPILWVLFMGGGGLMYSNTGAWLRGSGMSQQFTDNQPIIFLPFTWQVLAFMGASWLIAYGIIRTCAYVLDKKLSL
ncbi:MAG: hypothetical protein JWN30_2512 [Bacilli bacterium]|nr:hypothetical protein [Bacilli bacterium]